MGWLVQQNRQRVGLSQKELAVVSQVCTGLELHDEADQTKYLVSSNPTRNPRGGSVGRCLRGIYYIATPARA